MTRRGEGQPPIGDARGLEASPSYFEQAADALTRAFAATTSGEQGRLLDEALRLHRLAVAEERALPADPPRPPEAKALAEGDG